MIRRASKAVRGGPPFEACPEVKGERHGFEAPALASPQARPSVIASSALIAHQKFPLGLLRI